MKRKILLYIPPWIEQDRPGLHDYWVEFYLKISKQLSDSEILILLGEYQARLLPLRELRPELQVAVIKNKDIARSLDSYNITHRLYLGELTSDERKNICLLFSCSVGESYTPDFILSPVSSVSFFRDLYPSVRIITFESGLFSSPFPKFWYFDVFGDYPGSYMLNYSGEIRLSKSSESQSTFSSSVRNAYHKSLAQVDANFSVAEKTEDFQFNVLLPLQVSNIYSFDLSSKYRSQFHYLKNVMDRIDPRIGVVVTEHPFFPVINRGWIDFFETNYSNFIYNPIFQQFKSASMMVVPYVDAILNVSSTVAGLALLFDKPLISLGDNYFNIFSDKEGLDSLYEYLLEPKSLDRDYLLFFMLTNYLVKESDLFGGDYLNRLLSRLEKENGKIDFGFYEGLSAPDSVLSSILKDLVSGSTADLYFSQRDYRNFPLMPALFSDVLSCHGVHVDLKKNGKAKDIKWIRLLKQLF